MANAEPFFFPGNRVGCLMIHGFTSTPYEMRELGTRLAGQGYTVLAPVLAGHATKISDLECTLWPDWYATVANAYADLASTCDTIIPIGISLGGLLTLHLAAERSVGGLVAVSPPYGIHNPLVPLYKAFPSLSRLITSLKKIHFVDDTRDHTVRDRHPEYEAMPTSCLVSIFLDLCPVVIRELGDIRAPALLVQSRGDRAIPRDSITRFHAELGSVDKEVVWVRNSGHLILEDYEKEKAFASILTFVERIAARRQRAAANTEHGRDLSYNPAKQIIPGKEDGTL